MAEVTLTLEFGFILGHGLEELPGHFVLIYWRQGLAV